MNRIPEEIRIQQINALPNISFVRWVDGYKGSHSKAVCRCGVDGFEWVASVFHLCVSGTRCPQCSGQRRWTAEERIEQINGIDGIMFIRWAEEFKGGKTKAIVKCLSDGFEWPVTVQSLTSNGTRCPQCSGQRHWSKEDRIEQINNVGGIEFIGYIGAFSGAASKVKVECKKDGFQWVTTVDGIVNAKSGCPKCNKQIRWTETERIAQINGLDGIRFIKFKHGYKTSHSKATVRCTLHGIEWDSTVNKLVNGGKGCRQCGVEAMAKSRRAPEETRVAQINAIPHISFVRWDNGYKNSNSKAICHCCVCGLEWAARITSLTLNGSGCPQCSKHGFNPAAPGTLYILRSECGTMVKIGISNNHEQRHAQLRRRTPFDWHCIELLHSDDGSLIAEWEKELHSFTEPATFRETFDGFTEWRKWDDRLPMWLKRYRARLDRYNKAP